MRLHDVFILVFENVNISDRTLADLPRLSANNLGILGQHQCTDAGLAAIGRITNLQTLEIEGPRFTDAGLRDCELDKLVILDLRGTRVTDAGLAVLADLAHLHSLVILRSELDGTGCGALTGIKTLSQLFLMDVPVTDAGLREIAKLENLEELGVRGAFITDDGLTPVTNLTKLETLYIELGEGTFTQQAMTTISGMKSLRNIGLRPMASTDTATDSPPPEMPRE